MSGGGGEARGAADVAQVRKALMRATDPTLWSTASVAIRSRGARQLLTHLIEVIAVNVAVAACPDKVADF